VVIMFVAVALNYVHWLRLCNGNCIQCLFTGTETWCQVWHLTVIYE